MALYESYSQTPNDSYGTYGTIFRGQTFSAASTHNITSVKLTVFRSGTPGDVTIALYAADVNHKPTGSALASVTISANGLTTNTAGALIEYTFASPANLTSGTEYCLVFSALSGDVSNYFGSRSSATSPAGHLLGSANSGSTWSTDATNTMLYEIYGDATASSRKSLTLLGVS